MASQHTTDIPIRCDCGELRATALGVSPAAGNRVVCYCDDCQAFARYLGEAERILDEHGGTDIFQMSPAKLEFQRGSEQLACARLTSGGMLRWYTRCCRTPVGNTMAATWVPFVGTIHRCMDHASHGRTRDQSLGPVRGRVQGRFATGDCSQLGAHDTAPASMLLRLVPMIAMARIRGDHKRSPFLDPSTGRPIARPHVLSAAELAAAKSSAPARSPQNP